MSDEMLGSVLMECEVSVFVGLSCCTRQLWMDCAVIMHGWLQLAANSERCVPSY